MAAAEGRLSADELSERLDAAFRARTYGELSALLADLPSPGGLVPRASGSPVPLVRAVTIAVVLAVLLPIVIPLTVVALLATVVVGHHAMAAFFPLWLLWLAVFLVMRRRRRGSYGPFDGRRGRYGGSRGVGGAGRRGGPGFWV
jgi:uncharacterized membrane protein YgcG